MRQSAFRLRLRVGMLALLGALTTAVDCELVGVPIVPGAPPSSDVTFQIDSSADRRWIFPYIYGTNQPDWQGMGRHLTLMRYGGNRLTAYNWENNASNAGSDWFHQNDGFLGGGDVPGEAVRAPVAAAFAARAAALVTVPTLGYVAADKLGGGDVSATPNYLATRFRRSLPAKGAPFSLVPNVNDGEVYQDEFVNWLETTFANTPRGGSIFYSLDNEPDLWPYTHPRLHPLRMTYAELIQRTLDSAAGIKAVKPDAMVFGPALSGWFGFTSLGNAPGSETYGDFIGHYLDRLRQAEAGTGQRLVDVLDVHWYPEATASNLRVTSESTAADVVAARLQAPRSLWDPTYTEVSWITRDVLHAPIALLPRLQQQIDARYPGTFLAVTEYNYGAGQHISGGIAEADVLGIFGRSGVYAAAYWNLYADERFAYGALAMYRNFDGRGGAFGNVSVRGSTSDVARTSVYASVDLWKPGRMVIVALNKTGAPLTAGFAVTHDHVLRRGEVYRLTAASATPVRGSDVALPAGAFQLTLPPMSVTTLVLRP